MTIQRLFYTSRIIDEDAKRGPAIARRIAEASAARNGPAGLTGSLAFIDGHFIQVLEGEQSPLEETFERICCDFRHREVKLIDYQTVSSRQFAQWTMACLVDEHDRSVGLGDALSEIRLLATLNFREAVTRMRSLLEEADEALQAA